MIDLLDGFLDHELGPACQQQYSSGYVQFSNFFLRAFSLSEPLFQRLLFM